MCYIITFLSGILYLLRTLSTFCRCFSRILFHLSLLIFSSLTFCTISSWLRPSKTFPESRGNLKKNQRWELLKKLPLTSILISQLLRKTAISKHVSTWSGKNSSTHFEVESIFESEKWSYLYLNLNKTNQIPEWTLIGNTTTFKYRNILKLDFLNFSAVFARVLAFWCKK